MRRGKPFLFLGPLFWLLGAWAAHADEPDDHSAANLSLARELGNEGLAFAAKGDCAHAVEPLRRSEELHHAITTLSVLGECHVTLGKLVQGAEELTRVVREPLDAKAPASHLLAQKRARTRLDEVKPRIPKLHIVIGGLKSDVTPTVRLDSRVLSGASIDIDRPVDPGPHVVEAEAAGYRAGRAEATLKEGETATLRVELVPLPPGAVATTTPTLTPGTATTKDTAPHTMRRNPAPTMVSIAIGAVGLVTGSVAGMLTLSKTSSLDRTCATRSTCPTSAQHDIDRAKTLSLVSTIGFGVGAAGMLAGLYFGLLAPESEVSATPSSKGLTRVTVTPWVGVGSLGLVGRF